MSDPAPLQRLRSAVWFVLLALLAAACSGPHTDGPPPDAPYVVSYSGAAGRLVALDPLEAEEQLRDWARLGLTQSLGLDRDQIFDALYDTTPIRDPAFAELVEQPTGPGRGLFDGTMLHVLVPQGDPYRSRTVGLLLDEHRADAGSDPVQVQVHRYHVRPERQHIELFAEPPAPTRTIRTDNGWREARIDQPRGLADFLTATNHLSRLETRGVGIWAAGWRWPDTPSAPVTVEDVSVLQRGYQQTGGPLPGFSLDPGPPPTLDDARAAIPGLAPALAERITSGNWAGSGYTSAAELAGLIEGTLFRNDPPADALPARGLPADRTQLWALRHLLEGGPVYSQARYDGGLAGTEVGMSLFYTDFVAKDWVSGVGSGVPSKAVPGFVPDPQATTPPSLCPRPGEPLSESGRLWFGQNDTAFTYQPNGVGIGDQATRLFARSDGPNGSEVEPSFRFGRGLRWWDQHYQEIADYELQYYRLEQLMRWSGALEWLTSRGDDLLPQLPDSEIRSDLRFAGWYAAHDTLRERAPLTLVRPPSANEEAVLPTPSATTPDCGFLQIVGGVSLADGLARSRDLPSGTVALPPGVRRAGPIDPATTSVDPTTGSGRIDRITLDTTGQVTDRLTQVLRREPDVASVETTGSPRSSIPFGEARLKGETGQRRLETETRSNERTVTFDMAYQSEMFGRVDATEPSSSGVRQTDIRVWLGPLAYLQDAIKRVHRDPAQGLDAAPGVRYQYPGPEGQTVYRFDDGWIEVGTAPTSSRVSGTAEVATPGGVVEVRAVTPQRLSDADVAALRVTQDATVARFGDVLNIIPPDIPIFRADSVSLVGPEPAAALAAAIPVEALVRFRIARTTGDPSSPGPISREGRTWSLVDRATVGTGAGSPGGPGGPPPPGGGGGGPGGADESGEDRRRPGQIVLVTVCSPAEQEQPQQSEDCA